MDSVQYTIRDVDPVLDSALRRRALAEGKSLNWVLNETLRRGAGLAGEPVLNTDFDDLAGRWVPDAETEKALDDMRATIDQDMWS